jgi:hypothetical protein
VTRPCAERQEGRNACDSSTRVGAEQSNMGEGLGIMKRCIHSFTHIPAGRRGCRISAPGRKRSRRRRRRWLLLEPVGGGRSLVDGVALRAGITHFPPFAFARTFVIGYARLLLRRCCPSSRARRWCNGGVGGQSFAGGGLVRAAHKNTVQACKGRCDQRSGGCEGRTQLEIGWKAENDC